MPPAEDNPLPLPPSPSVPRELLEKITGCKVVSHTVEDGTKPGDNYMSVLYSVSAKVIPKDKPNAEAETRHYLLKCYPKHPARQAYLNKTNIFYNELSFYTKWAKELVEFQTRDVGLSEENVITPPFPPCVGGVAVDFPNGGPDALTKVYDSLDNFIMMVDLRKAMGFKMADRIKGLDFEHMNLAMTALATTHALSWVYRKRVEWDVVKRFPFLHMDFSDEDMEMWEKILAGNVATAIATLDGILGQGNHLSKSTKAFNDNTCKKLIQFFIEQDTTQESAMWNLHRDPCKDLVAAKANDEPWRIMCHGDSWINNMLFKYNEKTGKPEDAMLVDFQLTRESCPMIDLVYLVYTSTTLEFRKNHLDAVLQTYHDRFLEICKLMEAECLPGFNMESVKRRFHRSKPIGYMMALIGLPLMLIEKGQEVNLENADANAQMEDLFIEAFGKGGGSLYEKRMSDVAQELYEEGVI